MKKNLHPEYHEVSVHCACGETWTTRSTKKELRIEICSKCHPFFTGKQKLVDSAGRVERFRKRYEKKAAGVLLVGMARRRAVPVPSPSPLSSGPGKRPSG